MESCKRYHAKVLIWTLPRAPQHSISTLTKFFIEKCQTKVLILFQDFIQDLSLASCYACDVLPLKADLAACLYATGVPRMHLISAKTQMTWVISNFQSYKLSYLNWDTMNERLGKKF